MAEKLKKTLSVLFIGNSHTYYHRMPQMFENLAGQLPGCGRIVTRQR